MKRRHGIFAILLGSALVIGLAACRGWRQEEPQKSETKDITADQSYALKIGETEIVLGKTRLQEFFDEAFTVEVTVGDAAEDSPEWRSAALSRDMMLAENTIYQDMYLMKDGVKQAKVDVSTEGACPLSDAVITAAYISLSVMPTEYITFSGLALQTLTQDNFVKLFDGPVVLDGTAAATYMGESFSVDAYWDESGELTAICSMINP